MAAPIKPDRKLAADVRRKLLSYAEKILDGEDEQKKWEVFLRMAGQLLPRLNEVTGEDGQPIMFMPVDLMTKNGITANTISSNPITGGEGHPPVPSS